MRTASRCAVSRCVRNAAPKNEERRCAPNTPGFAPEPVTGFKLKSPPMFNGIGSRTGSNGHLWLRGEIYYAVWYRNGSRFCENTHKSDEADEAMRNLGQYSACQRQSKGMTFTIPSQRRISNLKSLLYRTSCNCVILHRKQLFPMWACGAVGSAHDWQS